MLRRPGVWSLMRHGEGCFRLADRHVRCAHPPGLDQRRESLFRADVRTGHVGSSESLPHTRSSSGRFPRIIFPSPARHETHTMRTLSTLLLLLVAASVPAQETIWIEAEHLEGIKGY